MSRPSTPSRPPTPSTHSSTPQPPPPEPPSQPSPSWISFHERFDRPYQFFLGEGGCETSLVFTHKIDLPCFATFPLYVQPDKAKLLEDWVLQCYNNAKSAGNGAWLDTKTWRANADWGARLGFDAKDLAEINTLAVKSLLAFRQRHETPETPIIVSGSVGPRRDGYVVTMMDSQEEYRKYHTPQMETLRDAGCDCISVYTLNHVQEAIGAALAARDLGMPIIISFTIEVDGKLATNQSLENAIQLVDEATNNYPVHYSINCAHPDHIKRAINVHHLSRIGAFFPNSSRLSHAELETATVLDEGEPDKIGEQLCSVLVQGNFFIRPKVIGGCCGTSLPHLQSMGKAFRDPNIGERYIKSKQRWRIAVVLFAIVAGSRLG